MTPPTVDTEVPGENVKVALLFKSLAATTVVEVLILTEEIVPLLTYKLYPDGLYVAVE